MVNTSARAYYVLLAASAMALYVAYRLKYSRTGRAFFAIRENRLAAKGVGIDTTRTITLAFCLSGLYAAWSQLPAARSGPDRACLFSQNSPATHGPHLSQALGLWAGPFRISDRPLYFLTIPKKSKTGMSWGKPNRTAGLLAQGRPLANIS